MSHKSVFLKLLTIGLLSGTNLMGIVTTTDPEESVATTDPVGAFTLNFQKSSDTSFALPLTRPFEYAGAVESISENSLAVTGTPWEIDDWTYGSGANPNNTYYLLMTSGTMKGMYYTIVENGNNAMTLDSAGDIDIETQGVASGDRFKIIPYWTLNTFFPNGAGVNPTPNIGLPQSVIIETNLEAAGVNKPLSTSYLYHDGSQGPAGWYIEGNIAAGIQNDKVLLPDVYYVMRNTADKATTASFSGDVLVTPYRTVLSRLANSEQQDNYIGLTFPVDITLAESCLASSPAFEVTSDVGLPQDVILLYDNDSIGINKPLGESYFYHDGSQGPAGWYIEGNIAAGIQDNQPVLKSGQGFVIRKQSGPVSSDFWTIGSPYNSN